MSMFGRYKKLEQRIEQLERDMDKAIKHIVKLESNTSTSKLAKELSKCMDINKIRRL
jgi:SPX domain protein involved in polyphosphate accumulation